MGVFEHYQERFDAALEEELSLQDYLELCKSDPSVYATAADDHPSWRQVEVGAQALHVVIPSNDREPTFGDAQLGFEAGNMLLNGRDITAHLRTREVESQVSAVSALSFVRASMGDLQRGVAMQGPVVAEGRDMGSVVFPKARWKIYLDAAPSERARRRCQDFERQGRTVSEVDVLEEIMVRDRLDSTRSDAPLKQADDALYLDTTGLTQERVIEQLLALVSGNSNGTSREAL